MANLNTYAYSTISRISLNVDVTGTAYGTNRDLYAPQAHDVKKDVELTSMQRNGIASTSVCRHFDAMYPLG